MFGENSIPGTLSHFTWKTQRTHWTKAYQVFLQQSQHMSYSMPFFLDPSGQLRKNYVRHFLFTSAGMCSLLCIYVNRNNTNTQLPGNSKERGKPNTGLSVLSLCFQMWCLYLIYFLHVFCHFSKHVMWRSSSLNVNLIIAVICLFIKVWRTWMVFVSMKISPNGTQVEYVMYPGRSHT